MKILSHIILGALFGVAVNLFSLHHNLSLTSVVVLLWIGWGYRFVGSALDQVTK